MSARSLGRDRRTWSSSIDAKIRTFDGEINAVLPTSSDTAIADPWRWWVVDRGRVAAAIEQGDLDTFVGEFGDRVQVIDGRLAWELAPGATSRHALIVTPEGDPAVRPLALSWLASAPVADAIWEYHASRQPTPLGRLQAAGIEVDLVDVCAIAGWDPNRTLVDVKLWHPTLAETPDSTRLEVAYLFLDNLLGEDAVERWIGSIDLLDTPIGGRTPIELREEVERRGVPPPRDLERRTSSTMAIGWARSPAWSRRRAVRGSYGGGGWNSKLSMIGMPSATR